MKYWACGLIGLSLLFGGWNLAEAVNYRVDNEANIDAETRGNVYRIGEKVEIAAPVNGDVIGIGSTVEVSSDVVDDLWLTGESVSVRGNHGGDLRVGAAMVTLEGNISGEAIIMASEVVIEPGTRFEGDVLILAGQVEISSEAQGSVEIRAGSIDIAGTYEDDVKLSAQTITLSGEYAKALTAKATETLGVESEGSTEIGNLRYWAPESNSALEESTLGESEYDESLLDDIDRMQTDDWYRLQQGAFSLITVFRVLSAGLVIALLSALFARFWDRLSLSLDTSKAVLHSLGFGFAALFVIPMISILSMVTVIAIPIAVMVLIGYGAALFFGMSVVSVVLARVFNRRLSLGATQLRLFFLSWGIYTLILLLGLLLPGLVGVLSLVLVVTVWGCIIRFVVISQDQVIHPE